MKKLLLLLFLCPVLLQAQTKTTYNVTFDGVQRKFIEFIPSTYDGSTAVPLVVVLHGLGDNADNFSNVGFEQLAELNNFIVITPEALVAEVFTFQVGTAWNSGAEYLGITLNSDVKDVDFISFLIDSASSNFNVDLTRVYATGFSMGGFMSNRLACELNDKIAAIGTVAGTIGGALDCVPGRAVPALHFHGTEDGTVPYNNNNYGTDAEETVEFWASNAGCSATPDSSDVADSKNDGITLKHYTYSNCDADVEFYKATGAAHQWLNAVQNDISYTQKIWEFLSRQSKPDIVNGLFNSKNSFGFNVYPNPMSKRGVVSINVLEASKLNLEILDIVGRQVFNDRVDLSVGENSIPIALNNIAKGTYVLSLEINGERSSQPFIVK